MKKSLVKIFWILCSLRMAVITLVMLSVSLAIATIIESKYDSKTAQIWVYQSYWFWGLLTLLGVEILFVALSRFPWRRRHIPFLTAHLGILILLLGSAISAKFGTQGLMRVFEGRSSNIVASDESSLSIWPSSNPSEKKTIQLPWSPPGTPFQPIDLTPMLKKDFPLALTIDKIFSKALRKETYAPAEETRNRGRVLASEPEIATESGATEKTPAIELKFSGGPKPMQEMLKNSLWLWEGEASSRLIHFGPALLVLGNFNLEIPGPWLVFQCDSNGLVRYFSKSSSGHMKSGKFQESKTKNVKIDLGWEVDLKVEVLTWIPNAIREVNYVEPLLPDQGYPAMHFSAASNEGAKGGFWLEFSNRATWIIDGKPFDFYFSPGEIELPFSIHLDKFTISHYSGTENPSEYSSIVRVINGPIDPHTMTDKYPPVEISMNHPLEYGHLRLYQSSFDPESGGRAPASIFSVNYDPGRSLKYLGSILIALGAILLFVSRLRYFRGHP